MCCKRIKSVVSVARLVGLACVASVAGVASVASQCSKCNNKPWVCILFNNNFNFQIHKVFSDPNGRFISNNYSPKWRWLGRELKPRRQTMDDRRQTVYRLSSIVYRLSSTVYRLSSIVHRPSSIVYRLGFSTCRWLAVDIYRAAKLIGSSNSEYPVLFTSEQLKRKWRPVCGRDK